MASLMGPSYMKMNEGTRLRVESERRVKVEEGEAWFNVGRDGRLFRVATPNGNITVFGTSFAVKVLPEQTIVTVQSGQVKVENETSVFRVLKAGQQARSRAGEPVSVPVAYAGNDLAWIDGIHAEARAEHLFYDSLMPRRAKTAELSAKELYWVDTSQGGRSWVVGAVRLTWDAESAEQQLISGYTVYVYDEKGNPLQKDYIPASVFAQSDTTSYEIRIKEKPLGGVGNLMVELAPDSPASKLSFRVTASGSGEAVKQLKRPHRRGGSRGPRQVYLKSTSSHSFPKSNCSWKSRGLPSEPHNCKSFRSSAGSGLAKHGARESMPRMRLRHC